MNILKSLYSTTAKRGRLNYFFTALGMGILGALTVTVGTVLVGDYRDPLPQVIGWSLIAITVPIYLNMFWLMASRIRDIGWSVAPIICLWLGMNIGTGLANAANNSAIGIVFTVANLILSLAILFTPGAKPKVEISFNRGTV